MTIHNLVDLIQLLFRICKGTQNLSIYNILSYGSLLPIRKVDRLIPAPHELRALVV